MVGRKIKIILTVSVTTVVLSAVFLARKEAVEVFPEAISRCNEEDRKIRFSCYRSVIEKNFKGDVYSYLEEIKNRNDLDFSIKSGSDTYAIFGTNCHTFYHALGDFAASRGEPGDLKKLLEYNPSKCTGGYSMGLFKRFATRGGFDSILLKEMLGSCPKSEEVQCAHEIGHLLHDKYTTPILLKLDDVAFLSYGLKKTESRIYDPAEGEDMRSAFRECDELIEDEKLRAQCRTGIGHNLFLFSEFSEGGLAGEIDACKKLKDKNTENECLSFLIYRVGINEAAAKFVNNDFAAGKSVCENIAAESGRPDLQSHCYVGLGGGIGLLVDSEYALTEINDSNLAVIKAKLNSLMNLCDLSPGEFRDNCYAGLFGTRFAKFYDLLKLYNERVEKLRPVWTIFEVVG